MNARDAGSADEWPLPPPWMWACKQCAELYKAMKRAPELVEAAREELGPGYDCDPFDSVLSTQIRLARHIALHHAEQVPDPDPACARCRSDLASSTMPPELVMEHRARHLFAPPRIVEGL
ncbi:hypothetical protein [Actinacidiphila acididurans]|nr:hypothetical protein [Actinacidiphila acididurans]